MGLKSSLKRLIFKELKTIDCSNCNKLNCDWCSKKLEMENKAIKDMDKVLTNRLNNIMYNILDVVEKEEKQIIKEKIKKSKGGNIMSNELDIKKITKQIFVDALEKYIKTLKEKNLKRKFDNLLKKIKILNIDYFYEIFDNNEILYYQSSEDWVFFIQAPFDLIINISAHGFYLEDETDDLLALYLFSNCRNNEIVPIEIINMYYEKIKGHHLIDKMLHNLLDYVLEEKYSYLEDNEKIEISKNNFKEKYFNKIKDELLFNNSLYDFFNKLEKIIENI